MQRCSLRLGKRIWRLQIRAGETSLPFRQWIHDASRNQCVAFMRDQVLSDIWDSWALKAHDIVDESSLRALSPVLSPFVITPVDKAPWDGIIL